MNIKNSLLFLTLAIIAILLSACAGGATAASSWPGFSVDDQYAYVAYNTQVYAIDLSNGSEISRYPSEPNNSITFYAEPAMSDDGQLIVGGYDEILYSLNPETGQYMSENWTFDAAQNRFIAASLVVDGNIYAPAADENLYALDMDGRLQWTFTSEGESWAQPITNIDCDCIYLTAMDHTVYAIDPQNGAQIWQSPELGGAIVGKPAYGEDGALYVGTFGGKLFALNTEDGSILWEFSTTPLEQTFLLVFPVSNYGWIWSGPALVDGVLYFGDLNGFFYAVDADTGQQIWQLTPEKLDGEIVGTPLVVDDTIYVTSQEGTLFFLDTSGNVLRNITVGGKIYTSPKTANDLILVSPVDTDELLVAYSEDGAKQWSFIPTQN